MKPLFALFISFVLIGIIAHRSGEPRQSVTTGLPQQTTAWCVLENENYAFWDKSFDRYASYWLEQVSTNSGQEVRKVNNLRIHQANAWAHPDQHEKSIEEADTLQVSDAFTITEPIRVIY